MRVIATAFGSEEGVAGTLKIALLECDDPEIVVGQSSGPLIRGAHRRCQEGSLRLLGRPSPRPRRPEVEEGRRILGSFPDSGLERLQ